MSEYTIKRRGIGIELKPSYYRQAVKNMAAIEHDNKDQLELLKA